MQQTMEFARYPFRIGKTSDFSSLDSCRGGTQFHAIATSVVGSGGGGFTGRGFFTALLAAGLVRA